MITVSSCPICGYSTFSPFLTCKDYTVSKQYFHLVLCTNCKLVITSPQPNASELGKYYKSPNYISHTSKANNLFDLIYLVARKFTLNRKTRLVEKLQPLKGTVLDVGCGTGDFLHRCVQKEWMVKGVEPSHEARFMALNKNIETSETLSDVHGKFNLITLWHVLEHVPDLNQTISTLYNLLTEDGTLLIAVPNHSSADGKKYKEYWAGFDVPRHLWHFNKNNMEILLRKNNFKLKQTLPMMLDSFYISLLSEQYKGSKSILGYVKGFLSGIHSIISAKKTSEYSSLIYIAQK